jgi:hypothetical protein
MPSPGKSFLQKTAENETPDSVGDGFGNGSFKQSLKQFAD